MTIENSLLYSLEAKNMHLNCILKLKRKFGILTALPKNQFGILITPEKMQFGAFTAYWFGQTKKVEFGETKAPR